MTKSSLLLLTIIALGLCSFTTFAKSFQQQQDVALFYNIFKDWISQYNKQYGIEEMAVRFYSWKSNYDLVQEHNAKDLDYKLEMNHFADITTEEFSALHLGLDLSLDARKKREHKKDTENNTHNNTHNETDYNHTANHTGNHTANNTGNQTGNNTGNQTGNHTGNSTANHTSNSTANHTGNSTANHTANHTALPKSVDWRTAGAVTRVKNQGQCGACWSFSASGALEGLHAIKNKKLTSFSEQQMIDCSSDYGNQGCDGGLMTNAFNYTKSYGIGPEAGYEYTAEVDTCSQNTERVAFRNTGFEEVVANSSLDLKAAVARQPVSIGIEASSMTVQLFQSGVITSGCGTDLDHGVLVVGYDTTSHGRGYWIVKNSWGPSWGLNGYFHIAMGSQNDGAGVCGINMLASYPTI